MFKSAKHERLTKLIQRLKRDYPLMMSVDLAEIILEELDDGMDSNIRADVSNPGASV